MRGKFHAQMPFQTTLPTRKRPTVRHSLHQGEISGEVGWDGRTRTYNLLYQKQMLYQLSYIPTCGVS